MFTADALRLGSLVLEWSRVGFLLGAVMFTFLAARRGNTLERTAWWVLLAALLFGRLGYLWNYRSGLSGLDAGGVLRSLLDVRTGGFTWVWALPAAGLTAVLLARRTAWQLIPAALGALVVGAAPLILRPASSVTLVPQQLPLVRLSDTGTETVTFASIDQPTLVNVWATWCPPCRLEMPLLTEFAQRGYPITFVDSRESPGTVQAFMTSLGYQGPSYLDQGAVGRALGVIGFPTTLLVGNNGQVLERHFGPLDRAQLTALFARHQIVPVP